MIPVVHELLEAYQAVVASTCSPWLGLTEAFLHREPPAPTTQQAEEE